ncbi:MAG TPA: hypothetical protein PLP73_00605 [Candidatus Absconditabacterales bacterium]|nr:hypothetical protein [Candidatus Absconditabacterales bacterium]
MTEKFKQYVELKNKIKELEGLASKLSAEIKDSVNGKINIDGYVLSKKSKTTYAIKEGIDQDFIALQYPQVATSVLKIDAKELYKIANDPDSLVNETTITYLELREDKKKESGEIDLDI